jgi:glycosyltransferase involved in cell wall biosynthesis
VDSACEDRVAKIVFVNRYFFPDYSATSQLLSDLAFDLASRRQDVHVITGSQLYTDSWASLPLKETIRGVRVHRVRTSRFGRARLWGRLLDYLTFYTGATWRLLRSTRPGDVIVAKTDPPMLSVCAAWIARRKGAVLVNWIQDLFPEVAASMDLTGVRTIAPVLKRWRNWSLRQGQCTVVLGSIMAKRLRDEGIPADRIRVIENWADGDAIQPVAKKENALVREWQLNGKFVVGYSGNMGHVHEFKTMIDAAELLRHSPHIAFLFVGDGIFRQWMERETERRRLMNVQFRPYQPVDRLKFSLSLPDVHLISLRPALEGLIVPSKFYGVAAAGRPVIYVGDPDGEVPRILRHERCGWTFRIGEANSLARFILALSEKPDEVTDAGAQARLVFERHYARSRALDAWRELLGSLSGAGAAVQRSTSKAVPVAVGKS